MNKNLKFKGGFYLYGWILKSGDIVPFEFAGDRPVRWLNTSYYKQGHNLKDPRQDFFVQSDFYERVS